MTGTAGSGKTSIAAHFADATCRRGERCLYFAFEESESQILRNMRSIGIDLEPAIKADLLRFHAARPTFYGLEMHLAVIHKAVTTFSPSAVILDPMTNLFQAGAEEDVRPMLIRLLDFLKSRGITALFTSLTGGGAASETTDVGVSSLMDTWLLLRNLETSGERNRGLYVLKSRGMAHSNQIREFVVSTEGVDLVDVYIGPQGVLTGSARLAQRAGEQAAERQRRAELEERQRRFERKRAALLAQIAALNAEIEEEAAQVERSSLAETARRDAEESLRSELADMRGADRRPSTPVTTRTRKRNGRSEVRS